MGYIIRSLHLKGFLILLVFISQAIKAQVYENNQKDLEKMFFYGARTSDIEILERFIVSGVDVNYKGENGYTALMIAAYNGQKNAVAFLLDKKADLCIKDNRGNTALMGSIVAGEDEIAKKLITRENCDELTKKRTKEFAKRFRREVILKLLE
jgi:ankyrin repeat protein